ncbi:MAG: hypothetical protein QOD05_701 [Microbacteriaceae bacterium]|nr:hypothetical protein [Microbacteriaceae bacterium]
MSQSALFVVRFAAALLPPHSRERYREQWLGELRDAPALGIRASEIAIGSLAFVATLARPMPGRARVSAEVASRRSRWAVALSLSAAIVAISQYASVVTVSGPTSTEAYNLVIFMASTLLAAYAVLAPLVAFVTVWATRGVSRRVRDAVGLLTLASYVPALRTVIDERISSGIGSEYLTLGTIVYPAAVALVAVAGVALWPEYRPLEHDPRPERRARRLFYSTLGGLVVAASVALGFADAVAQWAARTPLFFGYAFTNSNRALFEEWLTLKVRGEDLVSDVLGVWVVVGVAAACAVAAAGLSRRATVRRSTALSLGVLCVILVSYGGIVTFLRLMTPSVTATVPVDLVMLVGRWGLIVLVLIMVGRMRGRNDSAPARALEQRVVLSTADPHIGAPQRTTYR